MKNEMNIEDFFSILGLKASAMVAGLAGGLVSVLAEKRKSWKRALIMLVVGALTAGYVTPLVALHTHFNAEKFDPGNSLAFLIGLISMRLIDLIINCIAYVKKNPTAAISFLSKIFKK